MDTIVRLWDLESNDVIREFRGHTEYVFSVAFSPDGRLAYSTSGGTPAEGWQDGRDSAIRVWDVETGREVRRMEGHRGLVWSLAISPDGRRVLSGGRDMTVILWDAENGAETRRFRGHTGDVGCVAFLPDGLRAVSLSSDRTIRLWDVDTGQEIHCMRGQNVPGGVDGQPTWLAVSPDGRRLLSSSNTQRELLLWDLEACKLLYRLDWGNVGPIRGCFTPDGQHAAWSGTDGVVRLYRLEPGESGTGDSGRRVYLCDLKETDASVGAGVLGKNGDLGFNPGNGDRRIIVKGVPAKNGVSMHATARGFSFARYQLDGNYTSFHSVAATNDSVRLCVTGRAPSMAFSVVGDGRELWKWQPIGHPGESQSCTVNVTGVRQLELRVYCDSGDQSFGHAVWVDPYVQ
jgi:WD40 repeat protein